MEHSSPKFRLTSREKNETQSESAQQAGSTAKEFASVEEMLRYDAAQTTPPDRIAERLQTSIAQEPAPKLPWWRRWFSR